MGAQYTGKNSAPKFEKSRQRQFDTLFIVISPLADAARTKEKFKEFMLAHQSSIKNPTLKIVSKNS
jgi:hypothetical protein